MSGLELAGLVASIGGIVHIAGTAAKFSATLYRTARSAGSARKDIEEFAMDVSTFASVIRVAHDSIQDHCRNNCQLHVLQYVEEHAVLGHIEAQCGRIAEHIQALGPRMSSIQSRIDLITRFKWTFRKQEVQALHPKMECVKSSLILLMLIVRFELKGAQERTPDIGIEMKRLKSQVKLQIKMIRMLIRTVDDSDYDGVHGFIEGPDPTARNEQNPMVHLAESMVNHGHVPDGTSSSAPSGSLSESTTDNPNTGQSPSTSTPATAEQVSSLLPPLQPVRSRTLTPSQTPRTRDKGKRPESGSSNAARNRHRSEPSERRHSGHDKTHKRRRLIELHPEEGLERLEFHMAKTEVDEPLMVILDEELEENVVSVEFVRHHTSRIRLEKDKTGMVIQLPDGQRERSMQQVVLKYWERPSPEKAKIYRVRCWVSGFDLPLPVFGRQFIKHIRKYSQEGPGASQDQKPKMDGNEDIDENGVSAEASSSKMPGSSDRRKEQVHTQDVRTHWLST